MTVQAIDAFNRANETPLAAPWGGTGGTNDFNFNLTSNTATPTSLGSDDRAWNTNATWNNDQYSQANLTVSGTAGGGSGIGLWVRSTKTATVTGYRLAVDHAASSNGRLTKFVNAVVTTLASFTQAFTDGDLFRLQAVGTNISVYYKGTQVATQSDGAVSSGTPGIGYSSTETSASLDNWEGGSPGTIGVRPTNGTSTGTGTTISGTVTITLPTGFAITDYIICILGFNTSNGTQYSFTAPAGWVQIGSTQFSNNAATADCQVFIAPGTIANLGFTINGTGGTGISWSWLCVAVTEVNTSVQVDVTGAGGTSTAAPTAVASINTTRDNSLEMIGYVDWQTGTVAATGYTEVQSATTNCQVCCLYNNTLQTPAGATGTVNITNTASNTGQALAWQQFALRSSAPATDWAKTWNVGPNAPANSGNPVWSVAI